MPSHEYRFEDSPGLKHSCGVCGTPLNHPRAKKTCFGRHSEPCCNFHHTMFRMDRGSSCDACKNSREQHLKRHNSIAALVRQIYGKHKMEIPIPTPAQIAMAVHGYRELSIDDKRSTLDKALLKDVQLRESLSENPDKLPKADIKNREIQQVVNNLGVNTSRSGAKEVRVLFMKLAEAIVKDIDTTANESRETRKRQLGYYRYADKKAYNAIMEKINPAAVIEISSDEEGGNEATENDAQEEEEEEATPVADRPQEQNAEADESTPRATETAADFMSHRPQIRVRSGQTTYTFVPNTPVGTRTERVPNWPVGTPLPRREERPDPRL